MFSDVTFTMNGKLEMRQSTGMTSKDVMLYMLSVITCGDVCCRFVSIILFIYDTVRLHRCIVPHTCARSHRCLHGLQYLTEGATVLALAMLALPIESLSWCPRIRRVSTAI